MKFADAHPTIKLGANLTEEDLTILNDPMLTNTEGEDGHFIGSCFSDSDGTGNLISVLFEEILEINRLPYEWEDIPVCKYYFGEKDEAIYDCQGMLYIEVKHTEGREFYLLYDFRVINY